MKVFEVINREGCTTNVWGEEACEKVIITLYEPPYEDEDVLSRIKWNQRKVKITDITPKFEENEDDNS